MSIHANASLLVLLAGMLAAPASQDASLPSADPVRLVDGGAAVELAIDGLSFGDFFAAAMPLLGVPVQALPEEIAPARIHQMGTQRVERAAFRDAFEAALRREGFWAWDDDSGGSVVIVVRRAWTGATRGEIPFTPTVIGLEELVAGPRVHSPLYTVAFPLQYVAARDMLTVGMPFLDSSIEMIRHVEGSNQLLVTASREHLLALHDALVQVDVPGPPSQQYDLQMATLMQRLADLEKRLAELEKKAGG